MRFCRVFRNVSCRGYACILLRRVAFCYENKVAPRIIVLFVLDRGYLSVRGVFCFTPYGKRIIREVKQNEIWFFCKNWGLIWLPLTRVTPHGVGRCHEVTEGTAAVSGWRVQRDRGREKVAFFCSFTPSLPSSRQSRATSQLPFRSVLLSLRLEIATGNPHPRQREARIVETPTFGIEPEILCLI